MPRQNNPITVSVYKGNSIKIALSDTRLNALYNELLAIRLDFTVRDYTDELIYCHLNDFIRKIQLQEARSQVRNTIPFSKPEAIALVILFANHPFSIHRPLGKITALKILEGIYFLIKSSDPPI